MSREQVMEKIKKLLRLARSANRHEADLALTKALALAREHGVEIDGVNPDDTATEKSATHRETDPFARMSYDRGYACGLVQRFFRVKCVVRQAVRLVDGWPRDGRKIAFVGASFDIEVALYVYAFLLHRFAWCWRHERGRVRNRHAFVRGIRVGIHTKLEEAEPPAPPVEVTGRELALADHYIAEHFGPTEDMQGSKPSPAAKSAFYSGYLKGRETNIRPAIRHTAPERLALV